MKLGRFILYVDFLIALIVSAIFAHIVFQLPASFFPSPLEELYAKLLASFLLGFSISLALFIALDIALTLPTEKGLSILKRLVRPKPAKPVKPKIRPMAEELPLRFISKQKRLRGLAERMGLGFAGDILQAGETISPYRFAAKHLFYAFLAFFVSVPLGVAFALLIHPALLAVMVVPAIPLVYPKLKLRSMVGDRRRGLEDEVPFFTVFASILQSVGISLYNSLLAVIGKGVFRQVEKDALLVKRDTEFFFKSPVEALEDVGRRHPNEKMRTLLLGYTSEWRSGGDMSAYLDAKADDYLKDMEFRWKQYAERASDIGETTISLLFVFPMMILMAAFIFPGQALTMTSLVLTLVVPLLTVAVFGVVHSFQPKTYNVVRGDWRLALVAGALTFTVSLLAQAPLWLCMAASLAAATAIYGAIVVFQMREINMMEKALPQFLRDVTEYRKMGYDITKAVIRIAEENTYNSVFDVLLGSVARQLSLGVRMSEIEVPTRSWLTKMCFFLLAQVIESGGGTAKCLETLTNFTNHVVRVKRETRASMRLYQFLSLFTPIALSLITALMFTLLTAFSTTILPSAEAGMLGELAQIPEALIQQCYMLVVASSICVAMLSTKTVDLTVKNTLWITVNLTLASAGIAFSTQIASLLMKMVLGM
ncbi:MAG: type II secretion system F family protein [Candidatus Jordarchaeales archaeon]